MIEETINKAVEKPVVKPKIATAPNDPQKVISQLRQEIGKLKNTIKELQQKPDLQVISIMIPRKLKARTDKFILDYSKSAGWPLSMSEFICDAIEFCLWAEEENEKMERERLKAKAETVNLVNTGEYKDDN